MGALPVGAVATDAEIDIQVEVASSSTTQIYGLKHASSGQNWIESGAGSITFDNAPANDISGAFFTSDATGVLTSVSSAPIGVVNFSSTTALVDFINNDTDGLITLMVAQASPLDSFRFASGETSVGIEPTLELTYIPEPASVLLLGLGGVMLLARRRR